MYNTMSIVIFHFAWELEGDVWGTLTDEGIIETFDKLSKAKIN